MTVKISEDGLPMMSDVERAIIDGLIKHHKPKRVCEWGSGNSTIYFPKTHECIEQWIAVEHNGNYVKYLSDKLKDNTVVIWTNEDIWYVDSMKHSEEQFDFVFIDGISSWREKCLEAALVMIKPGGFILLHDAGREEYQQFILKHKGKIIIQGEKSLPGGGFAHRGLALFQR